MANTRSVAALAAGLMLTGLRGTAAAQSAMTYQKPPQAIEEVLNAPVTPVARVSPDREMLLIGQPPTFPTIADVAQPRYRLAGLRFNPATNGPSREQYFDGITLQAVDGGTARSIQGLPAKLKAWSVQWSPDSRWVAFQQRATEGLELW